MKRVIKALIAVYCMAFMCIFGGISAFAWDVDTRRQDIVLKNAPEGTAFADILVKDKKNDKYAACFNEENGRLLGVGKDCGLAVYDEDGYTSMLLRHNCAVFEKADLSEHSSVSFKLNEENNKLFNHFRRIKVACCDKDGNILGVTDVSGVEAVHFNTPAYYRIEADGRSLTCEVTTGPPYFMMVLVPAAFILFAVIVIAAIIIKRAVRKAGTAGMIKRIQSGEVDNERKQ